MEMPHDTISDILDQYRSQIGKDFEKYANHVCRVFLLCQKLDNSGTNDEKYAIAAAFHDLGIWTNNTFDYLEPSITLAKRFLLEINKEAWAQEISLMIDMHHKRSKYNGVHQKTVETFRRADWIDVTKGHKGFGVNKKELQKIVAQYPTIGFHGFLVFQTIKNFFKSPMNPLPMFKK